MTELELKIYNIVRSIPAGKVASYGQIAEAAGDPHLARVVGNVMHKNPVPFWELAKEAGFQCTVEARNYFISFSDENNFEPVPCHRVVNSSGNTGTNFGLGGPDVQRKMLELEGIEFSGSGVDLKKYRFDMQNCHAE